MPRRLSRERGESVSRDRGAAVEQVMLIRRLGDRVDLALLEDGVLVGYDVDRADCQYCQGNIYLGQVQYVMPSMEAAYVDISTGRNAVLYAGATGLPALTHGQPIMVQVTKDPIGDKGARLTRQVSLWGRYLTYVPGAPMRGISVRLPDTERARLRKILKTLKKAAPKGSGILIRPMARGVSEEELLRDVARLVAQWQAIERKARIANAPDLLYAEPSLAVQIVRDIFSEDFAKLVIASDSEWDLVGEYVGSVVPNLAGRLERWVGEKDLFAVYRIDEQLATALSREVRLPGGGSLVFDTTEGMTVINVSAGEVPVRGGDLEQVVTRDNLEAAGEIVRQLRLRNIGGSIVINFIDVALEGNHDLVLRRLIECLARDREEHQVAEPTSLGQVQMTRKPVGPGLQQVISGGDKD